MSKTYRQITYKLRVSRGPGKPDLVSERPYRTDRYGNRVYTDSDEKPTLVTFDDDCQIGDLAFWLRVGHLEEYKPPKAKRVEAIPAGANKPVRTKARKEVPDGKTPSVTDKNIS